MINPETHLHSLPSHYMKLHILAPMMMTTSVILAQQDPLSSKVVAWNGTEMQKTENGERKLLLDGSTSDLSNFRIHASTLAPGKTNHPPAEYDDREEIVIVKEGNLQVKINDNSRS